MATQEDIVNFCIAKYTWYVEQAPQKEDLIGFLISQKAHMGICTFVKFWFGDYLFEKAQPWIHAAAKYDFVHWCDTPMLLCNNQEIIKSLETRLRILKTVKL